VTQLCLASMQSASFSCNLSLCFHYIHLTPFGRSGDTIACSCTRHQALNSISVFNPVNGRGKREGERERKKERNCAVATLINIAVQHAALSYKIRNYNTHYSV
jgi:hypothetical protein